ncbi:MAG: protein kinase domain-containing protein, partial [Chthoniobacterales bacterium]
MTERQGEVGCVHCLLQAGMEPERAEAVSSPADFGTRSYQHYEILLREDGAPWELGRGAMGVTYKAIDVNLKIPVALKVLNGRFSALPDASARFLREAQAAAQLRHPNVASVFHFGVVNLLPGAESDARGDCFYAMEFVEGETLEEGLRRRGPLAASTAVELGLQVSRALSAAEKCGLVHRDLKPSNIMILPEAGTNPQASEESWVKVIDFGLAQAANTDEEGAGETRSRFLGTPEFASPEQLQGRLLDIRSDIYSLGCTLWYALAGAVPFGSRHEAGRELPVDELRAREIPPPLVRLLQSMLAESPDDRPESGAALSEALKRCRPELVHDAPAPGARKRFALSAIILAAMLIGLAVYFLMPGTKPDDRSIAVLPFKNLSTDPHDAFFAEGLEDDLVASLVKIHDLRVIGRKSAAGFPANEKRDLPAIGRALGVRHILQGSLRRTGDRVYLQVSLLDARDGQVLWAERYDRKLEDSVLLQGELAAAIADALDAKLTPREKEDLHEKPTTNADAYLLYLRGLKFESSPAFVISDYEAAQALYQQALALDRNFALAHARLSSTLGLLYRFRGPQQELKRDAFAEAREALRLQP